MTHAQSTDPALQPASVFLHTFPANLPVRKFQGIPGIACSAKGTLWATWYGGGIDEGPDNYILLATRKADAESWSKPWLIVQPQHPQVRTFDPTLWLDPQNRLWLFWAQVHCNTESRLHEIWDGRAGVWGICCENPDTQPDQWTMPQRFCDGIMMNKPSVDSDNNWLMPSTIWDLKPHHPEVPEHHRGPNVAISTDQGKTAQLQNIACLPDRIFDEHFIIPLNDGRWAMWARSKTDTATVSYSADRGKTWTPGMHCNIPCPNTRFFVGRLESGALLLISHRPTDQQTHDQQAPWPGRSHLAAWLSDDEGQTWHGDLLLDERWPVSYPDVAQGADGIIHVIYDFDRKGAKQIMLASITEKQIRQGTPTVCLTQVNAAD